MNDEMVDEVVIYLRLIRDRGDRWGYHGGTLSLLDHFHKSGTCDITAEEAKWFWENYDAE